MPCCSSRSSALSLARAKMFTSWCATCITAKTAAIYAASSSTGYALLLLCVIAAAARACCECLLQVLAASASCLQWQHRSCLKALPRCLEQSCHVVGVCQRRVQRWLCQPGRAASCWLRALPTLCAFVHRALLCRRNALQCRVQNFHSTYKHSAALPSGVSDVVIAF